MEFLNGNKGKKGQGLLIQTIIQLTIIVFVFSALVFFVIKSKSPDMKEIALLDIAFTADRFYNVTLYVNSSIINSSKIEIKDGMLKYDLFEAKLFRASKGSFSIFQEKAK